MYNRIIDEYALYLCKVNEVSYIVDKCGFTVKRNKVEDEYDHLFYYDRDGALKFSYKIINKSWYDASGSKMYNKEFKRFIKNLVSRLKELEAFW